MPLAYAGGSGYVLVSLRAYAVASFAGYVLTSLRAYAVASFAGYVLTSLRAYAVVGAYRRWRYGPMTLKSCQRRLMCDYRNRIFGVIGANGGQIGGASKGSSRRSGEFDFGHLCDGA